jgi:mRNA-degrading endonuclease RelE of RelBE toxin-antitoxin system
MVKEVIRAPRFMKAIKSIDRGSLKRVEKIIIKIIKNPEIGKPMRYARKGTREVYLGSFRLSYAYDLSTEILTFLDIYHKDEQ